MALLGLSPYTWIMIAFFILLVLVLVLGDIGGIDFDHDIDTDVDTGLSPMSLPIVAVFGASFGGYGTLLETVGFGPVLSPVLVPVLAMVFALLTAGGMYVVMLNVFVKTQAETRVDLESLKGFRGQVLVPGEDIPQLLLHQRTPPTGTSWPRSVARAREMCARTVVAAQPRTSAASPSESPS